MVLLNNVFRSRERFVALLSRLFSPRQAREFLQLLWTANPTKFDLILLLVGTVSAVIAGLPYPLLGLLYGKLMDDLNTSCGDVDPHLLHQAILQKVFYVFCIGCANFVLIYTYMGTWTLFGERLVYRIRYAYLEALLRQELSYHSTVPPGEVASSLDTDIQAIQSGTSEKVGIYITSLSYFVAAYVVAYTRDAQLTMTLSMLVPVYFAMTATGNHFSSKYTREVNEGVSAATSIAAECLSNMPIVQAFGASKRFESIFANHLLRVQPAAIGKFVTAACQLGALYFIAYASNSVALWQGSKHIATALEEKRTDFSFGNVYSVILLLLDASFIFTQVAPFLTIFATAVGAHKKLSLVTQRQSRIDGTDPIEGRSLVSVEGEIELKDVSFRYPSRSEVLVLDSLSLRIPAHKTTAIVGLSGSGKSTLASLITRLYDPTAGEVLLDGNDIRSLNTRYLRRNIALVEQDPVLLDRSVLENVAYGLSASELGITDDAIIPLLERIKRGIRPEAAALVSPSLKVLVTKVKQALSQAGALEFVENMEFGIATSVGPKGRQLSGGQRQRIAVARALIRDAPVIVLDEATAALDSTTEALIQATLEQHCKGKTIVVIAHRLSTIKNADKIVVLKGGRVLEQGTYAELVQNKDEFANLVRLQTLEVDDAAPSSTSAPIPESPFTAVELDNEQLDEKSGNEESSALPPSSVDDSRRGGKMWHVFLKVLGLAQKQQSFIAIGVSSAFFVGLSHTMEALLMGGAVDKVNICHDESFIRRNGIRYAFLFFCIGVAELAANVTSSSSFGWVSENLLYKSRVLSLRALLSQNVEWHESEGRTPNGLLSHISADAASLSSITGNVLGITFGVLVSLTSGLIVSHLVAWRIAVVLLVTVPFLLGSGYMRLRALTGFHEKHHRAFAHSVSIAKEAVDVVSTIAVYGLEEKSLQAYKRALREPYEATLQTVLQGNFWLALSYSISNVIYGIAYWWGSKMILGGYYTQAQFFVVLPALLVGAQGCGQLFSMAPDISRAGVAAGRVLDLIALAAQTYPPSEDRVLNPPSEKPAHPDNNPESAWSRSPTTSTPPSSLPQNTNPPGLAITLTNLHFAYPTRPHHPILHSLTLTIPPSRITALVGPSGSGKSTILALIQGLYTPTTGTVQLSGPVDSAYPVPQSPTLFAAPLDFNLALARPTSIPDLTAAARTANVLDLVRSLPEGWRTPCTTSSFSGGQRQRLTFARALAHHPRLLLLDEPTSALDAESEALWQEAVERVAAAGVTVVVVAHRLRTVRRAERILVIVGGRCVDGGKHGELVGRCGVYRDMVVRQALG